MKFTINRNILLENLLVVSKGLPNKTPFPILYAIKFEVYEDYLVLTAMDSDIVVQVTVIDNSLKVLEIGKVAIPGKYFVDIIKKVNVSDIEVELIDENIIIIKAEKSEFKLRLIPISDYPDVDFLDIVEPIVLETSVFQEVIREVNYATATNEKRPILTGINFKYKDDELVCTATDSYRLSQKRLNIKTNVDSFETIIPNSSLETLSKIFTDNNEEVEVYINPRKILFKFRNILFQSRLLEGSYPDIKRIIPIEFPIIIPFNKDELISSVEKVSLLSPRDTITNYNIIKLELNEDAIILSSNNNEIGNANDIISASGEIIGGPIKIAFSSKYLIDALKSSNSSEVVLKFAGDSRPFVIIGKSSPNLLSLILPVRIE